LIFLQLHDTKVIQIDMSQIESSLENSVPQDKLTALAEGLWGAVYKLDGYERVLKVPRNASNSFHVLEKTVYERLGDHVLIAQFLGEMKVGDGKVLGLLLQYYPYGSLKEYFVSPEVVRRPPDLDQKKRWASQAVRGLEYIHSRKVIHGDVGIKNLLLSNQKDLKFSDFGGSSIDRSKLLVEPSPCYHRPHSWRYPIEGVDSLEETWQLPTMKVDTFAVGTVLYEIFTGSLLHKDKGYDEVRRIFTRQEYPDLSDIPIPEVKRTIRTCWAEGYESMDDIIRDLKEIW
jgi:serine/threonine protein kinase